MPPLQDPFARTALDYGLLGEDDVRRCLERLAETAASRPDASFESVARELGVLTPLEIASIRELMKNPDAISAAETAGTDPRPAAREAGGASSPPTTTGVFRAGRGPEAQAVPDTPTATPPLRAPRRATVVIQETLPDRPFPGDFRAVSWIGRGPHGRVLLAEHPETREQRAIKSVPVRAAEDDLTELLDTVGRLQGFSHPNILRAFGPAREDDTLFLFSRPVEGLSSLRMSERVPLTIERACQVTSDLCGALEAAHAERIFHGNLKPENLLLSTTQEVLLADFGRIWRIAGKKEEHDPAACPLRCLPPELLLGAPPDPSSEVYGLAAILYELVTRTPLYQGPCREVREAIGRDSPTPPSQVHARVPADLETILLTALQRRPGDRYASPRALAYDLNAFLHGSPITARRPGWWQRLRRRLDPR